MSGQGSQLPVVLITTADMQSGRDAELQRMVSSVERFLASRPDVPLIHLLLLQRCSDAAVASKQLGFPARMRVSAIDRQVSLSAARNMMINCLFSDPPEGFEEALIAFPDDDAWYPEGVLEYIYSRFKANSELDFWFCRYGSAAVLPPEVNEHSPTLQQIISRASSNTIVVRGKVLRACAGFDENLGLGTPAGSGEDTDFAMRSFFAARQVSMAPYVMVGHRDFDHAIRANYYAGTLIAISRHLAASSAAKLAFVRKLLVGWVLVAKRDLSLNGMAAAWQGLRTNCGAVNPSRQWPRAASNQPTQEV
jgi:hypothetical protein